MQVVAFVGNMVEDLEKHDATLAKKLQAVLFQDFATPMIYYRNFIGSSGPTATADADPDSVAEVPPSKLAALIADFGGSKGAQLLPESLVSLYNNEHEASLKTLATMGPAGFSKHMMGEGTPTDLSKQLCESMRFIAAVSGQVVSADDAAAPAPGPRQLGRMRSDPDRVASTAAQAQLRATIWKDVATCRARWCSLSVQKAVGTAGTAGPKTPLEAYQSSLAAAGAVGTHRGILNDNHRLVLASLDLAVEAENQPRLQLKTAPEQLVENLAAFIKSLSGPTDFGLILDGRARENRLMLGKAFGKTSHTCNLFVVYQGKSFRAGRTRRTAFTGSMLEYGLLQLPCAVNKIQLQRRTRAQDSAAGESTTWNNTYTGTPFRATADIPLVHRNEKLAILG